MLVDDVRFYIMQLFPAMGVQFYIVDSALFAQSR